PGASLEQLGRDRCGFEHLLEVVEHQERLFFAQVIEECVDRPAAACRRDGERLRDGGSDQLGVMHRAERDKVDTVRELVQDLRGNFQAEARLARATGAGEGQQPRAGQQLLRLADLVVAADKARQLGRKIVWSRLQRLQWWK